MGDRERNREEVIKDMNTMLELWRQRYTQTKRERQVSNDSQIRTSSPNLPTKLQVHIYNSL